MSSPRIRLPPSPPVITHIDPLERGQEAFQLRNDKSAGNDAIHVLIDVMPSEDGTVKPIIRL